MSAEKANHGQSAWPKRCQLALHNYFIKCVLNTRLEQRHRTPESKTHPADTSNCQQSRGLGKETLCVSLSPSWAFSLLHLLILAFSVPDAEVIRLEALP